jgi:hypothetical protein
LPFFLSLKQKKKKTKREDEKEMNNKISYGQFFTTTNPFKLDVFQAWFRQIPNVNELTILEPFAGSNNIVEMISDLGYTNNWKCYDIDPPDAKQNKCAQFLVEKRDTIEEFPKGFKVGITNPPYLAKNSATRKGLDFPNIPYDDIYKYCLKKMLDELDYIAVIIPESFIGSELFQDRLKVVVSLTSKMFQDTECPVCLALFSPKEENNIEKDFEIYRNNEFLGRYSKLRECLIKTEFNEINWRFNDPYGSIGIKCIDNTKEASIEFVYGLTIDSLFVKPTSRSISRVSGLTDDIDLEKFIRRCNEELRDFRKKTKDVFLTPFKGLRADDMYRRRLDFGTARKIMNSVMEELKNPDLAQGSDFH